MFNIVNKHEDTLEVENQKIDEHCTKTEGPKPGWAMDSGFNLEWVARSISQHGEA